MLFFSIVAFCLKFTDSSMIVVLGEPNDWSWCYQIESTNWTYCLNTCNQDASCIVAYLDSTAGICYQCGVGQISSIKGSSSELIGFKAQITECTTSLLTQYSTSQYVITLDSTTNIWTIDYSSTIKLCDDGWALSNRQEVQWCVQIVTGVINGYEGCSSTCDALNATISGIGSEFEHQYLQKKAYDLFDGSSVLKGILVDGYMEAECIPAFMALNYTSTCKFPIGFTFADKYVSDYSFYKWEARNPDCFGGNQFCIAQYSIKNGSLDGLTDTVQCATDSAAVHASYSSDFTEYIC